MPEEIEDAINLITKDIAIAGCKLDNLSINLGGEALARQARRKVKEFEYHEVPTLEAIYKVYNLVFNNKL